MSGRIVSYTIELKHDLVNLNRELSRRDFLISVLKMKLEAYEVTLFYNSMLLRRQ